MDKAPNPRIRELCGVTKGMDEKFKGVLRWFGHVERKENDRTVNRVFVEECAGSRSVSMPLKR